MKSNLDKLFKTDKKLEEEGVEFAIDDKTFFRLRHFSPTNPRNKAAYAQHMKPYAKQLELGTLDASKNMEIQRRIFIDTCLVDWQGVEIDGELVACNKQNAERLFSELPALFDVLWNHCNNFQNFKEDVGNS